MNSVDYDLVKNWAARLASSLTLNGETERAVVAGGIRRGKPEPHDVEIVCQVKETGLFGDAESVPGWDMEGLNDWMHSFLNVNKCLELDPDVRRNGQRHKRFRFTHVTGIGGFVLDLFICDQDNWGNQLTIRTGDADFSKLIMTPRRRGGAMPDNLVQGQGRLWKYESWEAAEAARAAKNPGPGVVVPCHEEKDFFRELGLSVPPPEERNEGTARSLCYAPR